MTLPILYQENDNFNMKYELEKYRGSRTRYTCPSCGKKNEFARYIDENGDYLDESVGRCNRESSCNYHLTPKEYLGVWGKDAAPKKNAPKPAQRNETNYFDTIDNSFIVRSLENTTANRLLNYLLSFIDKGLVQEAVKTYLVGTTKTGSTVFWQIDREGRARTGKIISYIQETGKRDKSINPSWIHYELKKANLLPSSFNQRTCFFGEHLLKKEKRKPIAIVEAEKTAVVASIFLDKFLWIACGGKSYLKAEKLRRFEKRKIILYPDADGFELWTREATEANKMGLNVEVSRIIEDTASDNERQNGFDLADYLIRGEIKAQKWNEYVDNYNSKVEMILGDEGLSAYFLEFYAERLAIMETEKLEAEEIRRLVDYLNV